MKHSTDQAMLPRIKAERQFSGTFRKMSVFFCTHKGKNVGIHSSTQITIRN